MVETKMRKHTMKILRQTYIPNLFPTGLQLWSKSVRDAYRGNSGGSFKGWLAQPPVVFGPPNAPP